MTTKDNKKEFMFDDILILLNFSDLNLEDFLNLILKLHYFIRYDDNAKENINRWIPFINNFIIMFEKYKDNLTIVMYGLRIIKLQCNSCENSRKIIIPFIENIINILDSHLLNKDIIEKGIQAILILTYKISNDYYLNINFKLISLIEIYYLDSYIVKTGLCILKNISRNDENKINLGSFISFFVTEMSIHIDQFDLIKQGLKLLCRLSKNDKNRTRFSIYIPLIIAISKKHYKINIIANYILTLFWELSFKNTCNKLIISQNVDYIFNIIIYHIKDIEIVKIGMGTLDTISRYCICIDYICKHIGTIMSIIENVQVEEQKKINKLSRINFLNYQFVGNKFLREFMYSENKINLKNKISIVSSHRFWKRHILSFLSENLDNTIINDIIKFGFTILFFTIYYSQDKFILIPYIDRLMNIINNNFQHDKIACLGLKCILIFTRNENSNINVLIKHIKSLENIILYYRNNKLINNPINNSLIIHIKKLIQIKQFNIKNDQILICNDISTNICNSNNNTDSIYDSNTDIIKLCIWIIMQDKDEVLNIEYFTNYLKLINLHTIDDLENITINQIKIIVNSFKECCGAQLKKLLLSK